MKQFQVSKKMHMDFITKLQQQEYFVQFVSTREHKWNVPCWKAAKSAFLPVGITASKTTLCSLLQALSWVKPTEKLWCYQHSQSPFSGK